MVAHPSEGGSFEEGVEANVDAFHGNHGYKWQHIFVTVTSWCHLFVCFVASTMNMNNQFQLFIAPSQLDQNSEIESMCGGDFLSFRGELQLGRCF